MRTERGKALLIVAVVAAACAAMGVTDAVAQPGYLAKSLIKIALFLLVPIGYALLGGERRPRAPAVPDRRGILLPLGIGAGVFAVVLGAFLLLRNVFDFSGLTAALTESTGVNARNFPWVALYITLVNSLLEEFFFRGFAFLALREHAPAPFARLFSALAFALYHVAIMIGWFGAPVVLIALAGLFLGGLVFNWIDEGSGSVLPSWLVHMCADAAVVTIGFLLFAAA